MRALYAIGAILALSIFGGTAWAANATRTVFMVPRDIRWIPETGKGVAPGAYYAIVRGKLSDKCDAIVLEKFPDGFVYPWHVNHEYDLYAILKGTLVIGFDEHHAKSAERVLPAGSFMQGLATEPHYGRAVGETIFEVYTPCPKA